METISFVFSFVGAVGFVMAVISFAKVRELTGDLQGVKEELAKLRDQLGQGNATS